MTRFKTILTYALFIGLLLAFSIVPLFRSPDVEHSADDVEYSVDFNERVGAIKPLNGGTLWAKLSRESLCDHQADAEACRFSTIRLCDVPWNNEGLRLVDVNQIFANLNADPNDPNNYFFALTDNYIANILKGGSVPIYRLGTSFEHTNTAYFAQKPQDFERYAEICAGIVRHYNAGWANGFKWNILYWEIWNEPDRQESWGDDDWEQYCRFYVIVAKRLRSEFPDIKIGGPSLSYFQPEKVKLFAEVCKEKGAPIDFFTWHCYGVTPEHIINEPFIVRETLDEVGLSNTELHLNEWHYLPGGWKAFFKALKKPQKKYDLANSPDGMNGVEAAAFIDYVLTRWQDGPLDMSNYYAFGLDLFGVIDYYDRIRPTYYALRFFGAQISEAPIRVETKDPGGNVSLLGSVDDTGSRKRLLVSCYKQVFPKSITIKLKGVPSEGNIEVVQINYDTNCKSTKKRYSGGFLTLKPQKSSVFLIRFEPNS